MSVSLLVTVQTRSPAVTVGALGAVTVQSAHTPEVVQYAPVVQLPVALMVRLVSVQERLAQGFTVVSFLVWETVPPHFVVALGVQSP